MHPYRKVLTSDASGEIGSAGGACDDSAVLGVLFATGTVLLTAAACGEPSPVAAVIGGILVVCSSWSFARDVMARNPPQ